MARTPAEIDALADYTNAQMVRLIRWAIAELISDPEMTVTVAANTYTHQDLDKLQRMLAHFERAVIDEQDQAAADAGGACATVRYQEAS
ncbi:MAG TPA: hypothetical protein VNA25_23180 [Phycisphaerae bacterium]|nr:hypothetical protein [Phycisphaerae bacterium]